MAKCECSHEEQLHIDLSNSVDLMAYAYKALPFLEQNTDNTTVKELVWYLNELRHL